MVTKSKKLKAGTPEHKAQRWKDYQKKQKAKNKPIKSYQEWSNRYDANMKNPLKGNAAADAYHKEIGWGKREVPMYDKDVNLRNTFTKNQKKAYDAIGNGRATSVTPRGVKGEAIGLKSGKPIQVNQKINIAINNPNGGITYRGYP